MRKPWSEQLSSASMDDELTVTVRRRLQDGQPAAFKLRQLRWLDYAALGRGMPLVGPARDEGPRTEEDDREQLAYMLAVVTRAIVAERRAVKWTEEGPWEDGGFVPVRVVAEPNPQADPREISEADIDRADNVTRLFNALLTNIDYGGEMAPGAKFPNGRSGRGGSARENVRKMAPRAGARTQRSARA